MGSTVSRFFFPDPAQLASIGFGGLTGVPVLFDVDFRLLHEENQYLLERALGIWPEPDGLVVSNKGIAKTTLHSVARRLHHFRDWSDRCGKRWSAMRFEDVVDYQDDQSLGRGAFRGRPVSAQTANARADIATDFLAWAERRGLRAAFAFPVQTTRRLVTSAASNTKFIVTRRSRSRRVQTSPASNELEYALHELPERPAVNAWLDALQNHEEPDPKKRATAKYLICRFITDTGVRLHEAVALETRQWPSMALINRCTARGRSYVHMRLTVTKGGVKRTIRMSITLARTVRRWINRKRGALLEAGIKAGRTEGTDRLFLSDCKGFEGIPIQRHTVYDCFREVEPRPEGWHPHMARHAYACHRMKDIIAAEMRAYQGSKGPTWIDDRGRFAIRLIGRQFGHVSAKTTETYLAYLRNSLGTIERNDDWHHFLDR